MSIFFSSVCRKPILHTDLFSYFEKIKSLKNHYITILNLINSQKPILVSYSNKKGSIISQIDQNSTFCNLLEQSCHLLDDDIILQEARENIEQSLAEIQKLKQELNRLDFICDLSEQEVENIQKSQRNKHRKKHLRYYSNIHIFYRSYDNLV